MNRWEVILNTENEEAELKQYCNEEIQQEIHFPSMDVAVELLLTQEVYQIDFKRLNHKGIITEFKKVDLN